MYAQRPQEMYLFVLSGRRRSLIFIARNSGHRDGARAGLLGNMAAKLLKEIHGEIKQNKIEQVLAYREQVPRSCRNLESFLGYSD